MTAANHMLTGAVIAAGIQQPLLVVPLAFLSHFFLDVFPHFGVGEADTKERDKHPLFKRVLVIDIAITVLLLLLLPFVLSGVVAWWVLILGMAVAWIPDTVWVMHFWHDHKKRERTPPLWLTRFHQKIQWFEKPPGLVIELFWFAGMVTFLLSMATR